jgi:hypothetical protein
MLPLSLAISLMALGFFFMSTPPMVVALSEFGGEGYGAGTVLRPSGVRGGGDVPPSIAATVAEDGGFGSIVWRRIRVGPCIASAGPG